MTTVSSTVNLGLPATPEINDPKLFPEFVRLYNAIKLLSFSLDGYTDNGAITSTVQNLESTAESNADVVRTQLRKIVANIDNLPATPIAELAVLRKQIKDLKSEYENLEAIYKAQADKIRAQIKQLRADIDVQLDITPYVNELRKSYFRYTVPKFTVKGAFGCNGKAAQTAVSIATATTTSPAGGTGTAAGAFDTAANRDSAIAAINNNKAVLDAVVTALKANGILS